MVEPNSKDANHAPLRANLRRLQAARDQDGKPVDRRRTADAAAGRLRRPPPSRQLRQFLHRERSRARAGLQSPNDRIALNTLAELFPTREIVPIYSGDFIWGLGAMHCMTQQQPVE